MGETNPQAPQDGADGGPRQAPRGRTKKPIVFGKYELLARYRVGGMAEVWTARRLGSGDQPVVALKRILPSFTDEADYLAMFRDESRLAELLSHPSIARAEDVGEIDGHPYIVLEHVRGQNVAALIRKARELEKPVPTAMALRIALEVCGALEHAHGLTDSFGRPLEIVHRDVSPTNILLGYDGAVKLIDFGIAKSSEQLMRTQAGLLKGKHGYLSPEQASGEAVDARSDLFSLAICIWEMLAAKRLFLGASDFSSVVRVREAVVPPLADAGAPEAIERVLQRALARDPADRHASAAQLRHALEQAAVESGTEPATPEQLASYLSEVFADEISLEAGDEALEAPLPYEGTGLLDAFDDLEPVSTVSALAVLPDPHDEPVATVEDDELDEELELSDVEQSTAHSAAPAEGLEMVREPDPLEGDDATDLHRLPTPDAANEVEPDTAQALPSQPLEAEPEPQAAPGETAEPLSLEPAKEPAAEAAAPAAGERGSEDFEPDEPTRVVAYRSTDSGEVSAGAQDAAATAPGSEGDDIEGDPTPFPQAAEATLPGMGGVEWDDEELSTHLYDGPSAAAHEPDSAGTSAPAGARPSVLPFASRPSVAPFASRPSAAPFSARPAPASIPPAAAPAVGPAARPRFWQKQPWLLPAVIAAAAVVSFIALSMLQSDAPGTIQLVTVPPDARVLFDGQPAASTLSPFVIVSVKPGERHAIEVSADGYRTWTTELTLGSGQTLQLPEVELVPMPPSTPVASSLAAPAVRTAAQDEPAEQPSPRRAAPQRDEPAPRPAAAAAPQRAHANEARGASPQVAPRTPAPARPVPAPVAQAPAVTGSDTGMLRVNSRPWAQVHVDGRLVGNTPQMSLRLSAGRHTILLLNPEFGMRKTFTVQIRRGAVTTKIVELAR